MSPRYQPFYCEENVWWQVRQQPDRYAVFMTNADRRVLLWQQRLAPPGEPVLWDYHVVTVAPAHGQAWVHDLDSRLPCPCPAPAYWRATFPYAGQHDEGACPEPLLPFVPRFRVVPAAALEATFASDRSHMQRPDGSFLQPPPPWPAPGAPAMTLPRYLDLDDPIAGEVMDLAALLRWSEGAAEG